MDKRRLARLQIPDGKTRPYRPLPGDFEEQFIKHGWQGIVDHYRTNWRVVKRWLAESGEKRLQKKRAAYVKAEFERRRGEATRLYRKKKGG